VRPQPPQLLESLVVSTQNEPQHERPGTGQPLNAQPLFGATQVPLTHESPPGQKKPQPPQLLGSPVVSMHPFAQHDWLIGQPPFAHVGLGAVHWPLTHESPKGQTTPHAPQLFGSKLMFAVQLPPSEPASSTTHCSLLGSHDVPAGQAWVAQEMPFGSPSSAWSEEREQPAKSAPTVMRMAQ
jgi:hypothetical protein